MRGLAANWVDHGPGAGFAQSGSAYQPGGGARNALRASFHPYRVRSMENAAMPKPAAALATRLRLALRIPLLSGLSTFLFGTASGDLLTEATVAGILVAFGSGLGILMALSRGPGPGMETRFMVGASTAAFLMASCYAYARIAGVGPVDTRVGLAVILMALGLATVANSALELARVKRAASRSVETPSA